MANPNMLAKPAVELPVVMELMKIAQRIQNGDFDSTRDNEHRDWDQHHDGSVW